MANILESEKRVQIVKALCKGNSIRATSRRVSCSKNTTVKLLVDLGAACSAYQDEALRDLDSKRVQLDGIWSFCEMKAKTASRKGHENECGVGEVWTFVAIDADTKLVPSWLVGSRDVGSAIEACQDLAQRVTGRIQLTTAGHSMDLEATEDACGVEIDHAMLQKVYGEDPEPQNRYSPALIQSCTADVIQGCPEPAHVATSYVERQNPTMRRSMRRFARLTKAFSRKIENLAHAVSLHFMVYNFVRKHRTLTEQADGTPTTPAMAAGVADRPMTYEEVISLLDPN